MVSPGGYGLIVLSNTSSTIASAGVLHHSKVTWLQVKLLPSSMESSPNITTRHETPVSDSCMTKKAIVSEPRSCDVLLDLSPKYNPSRRSQ